MKRDFSDEAYNELISLIDQVENEKICDFTDWIGDRWYSFQEMIGCLKIDADMKNINDYHKKVIDKNNTAKSEIDSIFREVNNIDLNYSVRLAAYKTQLEQFINLVKSFSQIISPSKGCFQPELLDESIDNYNNIKEFVDIIGNDGADEDDLDNVDEITLGTISSGIASSLIDLLPDVKADDKIEIPVGPGASIYCYVESKLEGSNDLDVNLEIENQKLKLKNISYSKETDGAISFGVETESDGKIKASISSDNAEFSINNEGKAVGQSSLKVGNDTYTIKLEASLREAKFEESIKSDLEGGYIKTAIGMKKESNDNWKVLPEPVEEPETWSMPSIEWPEIDWNYVAIGTAVIVGGCIILAPATGGTSLVPLLAL